MSERSARNTRLRRWDCCGDVRGGGRGRPIGSGWAERLTRNGWGEAQVRAGHGQHRQPPGESGRGERPAGQAGHSQHRQPPGESARGCGLRGAGGISRPGRESRPVRGGRPCPALWRRRGRGGLSQRAPPPAPAGTGRVSGRCRPWGHSCLSCSRSFFSPPLLGRRGSRGRLRSSPSVARSLEEVKLMVKGPRRGLSRTSVFGSGTGRWRGYAGPSPDGRTGVAALWELPVTL